MTKQYEFRILEEKGRAGYSALSEASAISMITEFQSLPEKGVLQLKCPETGKVKSFKIVNGSLLGESTSR